jgi:hypothetical protein
MKFPIVNILTLFIACCSMCACSTLRPGEFIPTEGKIQWIAADGKTNLILFGDYEQIKDKHKWRIPHPCRSTSRETTLLMAQTSAEPYIGLTVKQSRLNMLVYSSGTVILKDTIMNSQNGMPLRMQILHLSGKQGPLTEIRYIWENDPKAIQFHFWSNRENQDALLRESETIMNSFAIK